MFFCAHAIFYFKLLDQKQDSFLLHENVYFIEAEDENSASEVAFEIGKQNEDLSEDGHLQINEKGAAYIFAGLRKIIEVELTPHQVVVHGLLGLELTYSEFEVDSLEQVRALVRGEMVEILYRE